MNKDEAVELLKSGQEGVREWNELRGRYEENMPDLDEVDFETCDLTGVDFSDLNLRSANFKSCCLEGANFEASDLTFASLCGVEAGLDRAFWDNYFWREVDSDFQIPVGEDALTFLRREGFDWEEHLGMAPPSATDFSSAILENADLGNGNFREVDFSHSNLKKSKLSGANLRSANLVGVDFTEAELGNADVRYALVGESIFVANDLREVQGLDALRHAGPSVIDMRTLDVSVERLSGRFLRGVGVSESLIKIFTPDSPVSEVSYYSCFLSYSHGDKRFADRLYDHLQARSIRCWVDDHDLKPGDRILDALNSAIGSHDRILLCCSETSLKSWWVKDEIRKAQERERREDRDIIIPLMVDRYLLDGWEDGLAADLRSRLGADFTGWQDDNAKFEEQFERVVRALRTDEG